MIANEWGQQCETQIENKYVNFTDNTKDKEIFYMHITPNIHTGAQSDKVRPKQ